jgi:hypothetical protein
MALSNDLSRRIEIRATPEQFEQIHSKANAAGLTVSDYLRQVGATGSVVINHQDEQINELNYQLIRIGTNLNQLAKLANSKGEIITRKILPVLNRINEIVRQINFDR